MVHPVMPALGAAAFAGVPPRFRPLRDFQPELRVGFLDVLAADGVLKLEVTVAAQGEAVGRVAQAKARAYGKPFVQHDVARLVVG